MKTVSRASAPALALLVLPLALAGQSASAALATAPSTASTTVSPCAAMVSPAFHRINPKSGVELLTLSQQESDSAKTRYGFTVDAGRPFSASGSAAPGLVAVHRLHSDRNGDLTYIREGAELDAAVSRYGYTDVGVVFYALGSSSSCSVGVYRYQRGGLHRFAVTAAERAELDRAGWKSEGPGFYAAPAPAAPPAPGPVPDPVPKPGRPVPGDADGKFSIAVMPDTQQETGHPRDTRFIDRTRWLVANRKKLDLRFVAHSGDVVNWGWLVPAQYTTASEAMRPLEQAHIPYALAVGNHDTRAVGFTNVSGSRAYGGSAYVNNPECAERLGASECKTWKLVRHTEEFNAVFDARRYTGVAGAFEPGKVDNIYSTFDAGGKKWMVLTLELWPRTKVVDWANQVVASHPHHNVIIQTHSYLTPQGKISTSAGGYGANSPSYLYDHLVARHKNIKLVFSGHNGRTARRVDTGVAGNKIVSYLECMHSDTDNPVRLVEIDVKKKTVTSKVVGVNSHKTYEKSKTQKKLAFV